ncbi:MAG: hypothetical protein JKY34_08670 [Kordiimonadaceae bacterium]|nr:hypothetical protein [Kordiimonadaceae bacterium]
MNETVKVTTAQAEDALLRTVRLLPVAHYKTTSDLAEFELERLTQRGYRTQLNLAHGLAKARIEPASEKVRMNLVSLLLETLDPRNAHNDVRLAGFMVALADYPEDLLKTAIHDCLKTLEYPPKPSDLVKRLNATYQMRYSQHRGISVTLKALDEYDKRCGTDAMQAMQEARA